MFLQNVSSITSTWFPFLADIKPHSEATICKVDGNEWESVC
jgi:hypothetical protein